ncbi:MAG TPA: phosphoglycerate kinase [Deltaproteobacteria bacterium]|nr:phosphoglycerate kinase [Deltaproteobacteria bacterium]HDZ90368.1 phosphoglycerate kinase [Deltaproteobacteria bacterium]
MEKGRLDPRLRLIQEAPMEGKVVLLRVDHNVVKKGRIKDPYRIDATIGTLYAIAAAGGKPILITHVGRPRDKKTDNLTCREEESVEPIARYIEQRLPVNIHVQGFPIDPQRGIRHLDASIAQALEDLKKGKIGMIYLPNSRWFQGEQSKGPEREIFANELAAIADIYVNDAFGSWRAHASTYDVAGELPSFAGILLQKELMNLHRVLEPERPFVGIVAGAKYDTKIGPLKALYKKVDHLVLGGLMYNTFVAARYGVDIAGVSEEDRALAMELVELDRDGKKIVEMPFLIESETFGERVEGKYRSVEIGDLKQRRTAGYILDIDPRSFEDKKIVDIITTARTIFVNAVMGFMPLYFEGSRALYNLIGSNDSAARLFAGGDTLQELRNLCPGIYMAGLDDPGTYYFTGGGSVLAAIEQGTPYDLKPVKALMDD